MKRCVIDIETTALHPAEGRIICIGIMDVDTEDVKVFQREDEAWMIIEFLNYYRKGGFNEIIGYNILFDTRFIFGRCLKHGIMAAQFLNSRYTDLMHIMKSVRPVYSTNRPGKLGEWADLILGDGNGKITLEEDIKTLYEEGRIREIVQYNEVDVLVTYRLWERVQKVMMYGR